MHRLSALKREIAVPPGMFVFSKPVRDAADLQSWRMHFTRKGIASAIIALPDEKHFVLCREGEEACHESTAAEMHRACVPKGLIVRRPADARKASQ